MKAHIISIDEYKGFARDESGQAYYFNMKHFINAQDYLTAKIGSLIEFKPSANEKGISATQIKPVPTHDAYIIPEKFIYAVGDNVAFGNHNQPVAEYAVQVYSVVSRNSDEALADIKAHAQSLGANFLIKLEKNPLFKMSGNYQYTSWFWSGIVGIYGEHIEIEDCVLADKMNEDAWVFIKKVHAMATSASNIRLEHIKIEANKDTSNDGIAPFMAFWGLWAVLVFGVLYMFVSS